MNMPEKVFNIYRSCFDGLLYRYWKNKKASFIFLVPRGNRKRAARAKVLKGGVSWVDELL